MWPMLKFRLNSLQKLDHCLDLQIQTSQLTELGAAMLPDYENAAGFIRCKNKTDQVK